MTKWMMRSLVGLAICSHAVLVGCTAANQPLTGADAAGGVPLYKRSDVGVEERVADLLRRMTLEEKARQLDMYRGDREIFVQEQFDERSMKESAIFDPERARQALGDLGAGSVHDLYPTPRAANALQSWIVRNSRLGIPALFIEEGLHGLVRNGQTMYPQSINLAATWNTDLAEKVAQGIAAEARAIGVHMILSPVLCLARDPRWGRTEETFGEDPYLAGCIGLAYVQGAQGESLATNHTVIAEPKHFAAHGSPESGLNMAPMHAGERELRMTMLKSFEAAIREGKALGVMAAYHEIDGIPCAASSWLLTKVLREEWGFQGFVLSDLGAVKRLHEKHHTAESPREAICQALQAGVDMQFYDYDHATFQGSIIAAVKEGQLPREILDRAVARVLRAKFLLGLFDNPFVDEDLNRRVRNCAAHRQIALEVARQSMCLLKNEGNLLPLSRQYRRIAVIGPNADEVRQGDYTNTEIPKGPTMLAALTERLRPATKVVFNDGKDISSAVAVARDAEVAILGLGEWEGISGEACDRADIGLPENQQALLEAVAGTKVPVVLVLQNGRAMTISWAAEHLPAILEAWYPGELGGQAIAETLLGENNPAGRLPVSFPRHVGQLPITYDHNVSKTSSYVDMPNTPLFPFGHGLSYTTFQYDNLRVTPPKPGCSDDVLVNVDVTNTGTQAGDEVVQVYVRQKTTSVVTSNKALKAFERIHLRAGAKQTVTLKISVDQLAIWNLQGRWIVEPGEFVVMVGGSSATTLTSVFRL